jgi:phosphate starvation-inducible PhoH-like protein
MGNNAKFIITGDATQIDLPLKQPSGLLQALRFLKGIEGIDIIELDHSDVIRHRLVKAITQRYEANK